MDPHRIADVAAQLTARVWADQPDAVARWLVGELDGLDRWRLLLILASLAPLESPGELLARLWSRPHRETTDAIMWRMP